MNERMISSPTVSSLGAGQASVAWAPDDPDNPSTQVGPPFAQAITLMGLSDPRRAVRIRRDLPVWYRQVTVHRPA
jgi:hypothetical protein